MYLATGQREANLYPYGHFVVVEDYIVVVEGHKRYTLDMKGLIRRNSREISYAIDQLADQLVG